MSRLLPRFYAERQHVDQARKLARILLETGERLPVSADARRAAGDPHALRGIPAVGIKGGIGGAIAGTRPGDGLVDEWVATKRRRRA